MSNVDSNVTLTKKKRKKRRKRNPSIIPSQPVISPVNTIAALFKLQQKLANKNISDQFSSKSSQDKPLTSGPRFRPNMKWINPALSSSPKTGPTLKVLNSTLQEKSDPVQEKLNTIQSMPNPQTPVPGPSQVDNKISDGNQTKNLKKSTFYTNKIYNSNINQNDKFHDCEVYDSPSFINFESDDGVADLNDDDICNKNIGMSVSSDKINVNKPDTQISFEAKLQKQHAKKLESRNQSNTKSSKPNEDTAENTKKLSSVPSIGQNHKVEITKQKANLEITEALSAVSVVRDKIKITSHDQNKHQLNEQQISQSGVPKAFMNDSKMSAIQPIDYLNPSNTPIPVQMMMMKDKPLFHQTDNPISQQVYSPTDIYADMQESPEPEGRKRRSAFHRLGPSDHKTPRLTINVTLSNDHAVRDVIDETEKYKPTYEKQFIVDSKDPTVVAFLPQWPWRQAVVTSKTITSRNSKKVMSMDEGFMEEIYDKDNGFILISLEGYPENWTKEDVLDLILESLKGKHFIPCFVEFTPTECKFFTIRSQAALSSIHSMGFKIRKEDVEVYITISHTLLTLKQLHFNPRIILRSRLALTYNGSEAKLDLSEFTLKEDISHFVYFPLRRVYNQSDLVQFQSPVRWQHLTELNLSRNRLQSIEGFNLEKTTPRLKVLDLSHNCMESVLQLMTCRQLDLIKLTLDGNPLCNDYIQTDHYIKVLKTMFSSLRELDGVEIVRESLPRTVKNYCPEECRIIVEKFLEIFFPLLECCQDERRIMQSMYADGAIMTITHNNKLRYKTANKLLLDLLIKSRVLLDGDFDLVQGRSNIVKLIKKWPNIKHDASTFTVDVVYSTDTSIIFTINGIFKITAETLAQNETLLSFSRTMTLFTENGFEYKIINEMIYFDEPHVEWEKKAFQRVVIPKKILGLKLESPLDEDIKERLVHIFMKITSVDKKQCESYLVEKNWNFKDALEIFTKVFKSSNIETIM